MNINLVMGLFTVVVMSDEAMEGDINAMEGKFFEKILFSF
jgi:hypothetical protein